MASANPCPVLAYDVGGSHIAAALCFPGDYRLGAVASAPHPAEQTPEAFTLLLHTLGAEAAGGAAEVAGAELAFPGPFDFSAGISHMRHKLPYLYGFDLRAALAAHFGWEPARIRFLNDAQAFLLGEIGAGAARGAGRAVGITLGTGIGSAFAVGGRIVTSGPGVAPGGEIWNLPFAVGIVEDAVSSRSIRKAYELRTGQVREVAELARGAAADEAARDSFSEFGRQLGLAMRQTLTEFAPDVVVLGGGICHSPQLFLPDAEKELEGLGFHLRISTLFERAALVGAGVAWFHQFN
ncbi:MAG: ROK family protein [Terracidiphilus sp.]